MEETPPRRARATEPGRGKAGTKYHLLVTADGLPLAVAITEANRHDSTLVEPILLIVMGLVIAGLLLALYLPLFNLSNVLS